MDFSSIPVPANPSYVVAAAEFRGDESQGQLSFLKGDKLLVLRAKPGAPWAIGMRVGSEARGLYPVEFCRDAASVVSPRPAAAVVSPRPAATVASSPRPAVATAAASPRPAEAFSPRKTSEALRDSGGASSLPGAVVSSRPIAATSPPPPPAAAATSAQRAPQKTTVRADFSVEQEDVDDEEGAVSNMAALSGVASATGDGLRYEYERAPEKHVMETDKKGKSITCAVRRWMLIKSAAAGGELLVKQCLKNGVPVDFREPLTGDTALIAAVLRRQKKMAMFLIKECHAAPNCVNNAGQSALHIAVSMEDEDLALFLTTLGVDLLQKDDAGNAPLFMCKSKLFEQKLRKAEKKAKDKLTPIVPPGCEKGVAPKTAPAPEVARQNSVQAAAAQLIKPVDDDAKSVKGVAWNTLRGTTDCVDVIFVFIAGSGKRALPVPIKKTTSADDIINIAAQKLYLTEFQRHLMLSIVSDELQASEIPGFKSVLTVKQSYPRHKFVLFPQRGANRDVAQRLVALAEASEALEK